MNTHSKLSTAEKELKDQKNRMILAMDASQTLRDSSIGT
jgi:hypothetical protein